MIERLLITALSFRAFLPVRAFLPALSLLACFFIGCAPTRAPVPPGVIPTPHEVTAEEEQYGHTILSQLSEKYQLDFNDPRMDKVNRVVERLTKAAGVDKSPWHVYLFRDASVKNAAATRGNHVFIWSGMLDFAQSEDELATVLSHELSHVLAGHTDPDPNEELKNILIQVGAAAVGIAITATTKDPYLGQNLGDIGASVAEQIGNGFLVNPYSQQMELEADEIGLMIMSKAHFDPQAALDFWTKMEQDPDASSDLQFFSTHPPAEKRLEQLRQALPLAEAYYRGENPTQALIQSAALPVTTTGDQHSPGEKNHGRNAGKKPGAKRKGEIAGPIGGPLSPGEPDSFAIKDKLKVDGTSTSTVRRKEFWRVTASGSPIYREPSERSEKIGYLGQGDLVDAEEIRGGWVFISGPQADFAAPGYVPRSIVEKAFKVD